VVTGTHITWNISSKRDFNNIIALEVIQSGTIPLTLTQVVQKIFSTQCTEKCVM
jgi:hypothetical protein